MPPQIFRAGPLFTVFVCIGFALSAGAQPPKFETVRLKGTVVDDKGQHVANATVYAFTVMNQGNYRTSFSQPDTLTDAKGEFTLDVTAGANATLALRARHENAVTSKPVIVTGDKLKEPVSLTISPKFARAFRVRVTDSEGKPVAKAKINVTYFSGGLPDFADSTARRLDSASSVTDDGGRWEAPPCLAPDGSHRLDVEQQGFLAEKTQSKEMPATGALDFGTIVLRRIVPLNGQVLDTKGKPVEGARVIHSDARQRVEAPTDEFGNFTLKAAFAPPSFLFVEKAGFRFHGQPCEKPEELKITLRRRDEPAVGKLTTLPRVMTVAERKALAEQLSGSLLKETQAKTDDDRLRPLEMLAKFDPGRLLEELEKQPVKSAWYDSYLKRAAAKEIMGESLDEARSIVDSMKDPGFRSTGYIDLCDSLPDNKKAEKIELLNQALLHSKAVSENDHRILEIAQVARRLWALGEQERATKLLREGEAIAKELPTAAWAGYARGAFAEDLGLIDVAAALALMKDLKDPYEYIRHHGNMATKLAKINPAEAERVYNILLKYDERQAYQRDQRAIQICYFMASADLPRARKIAETIKQADFKARAYGVMAEALAKEKPKEALALLDRSFEILGEFVASGGGRFNNIWSAAGLAGVQLPVAEQIDPALVPEFLWRTVSLHAPQLAQQEWHDSMGFESCALGTLAMVLARYDRDLALRLAAEAQSRFQGTTFSYGRNNALLAIAVLDPKRAVALVQTKTGDRGQSDARNAVMKLLLAKDDQVWHIIRQTLSMNQTEIGD
jgi:protocatechuate 3,4-dioxygenase beta subunit